MAGTACQVALLGVPYDGGASFARGAAEGPRRVRETLRSPESNLCTEDGLDLAVDERWSDAGDVSWDDEPGALAAVEAAARRHAATGERVLAVGGDHSVTWPLLRAAAASHGRLDVVHLDAHPDLYDEFAGRRDSHACPFARALEEGLIRRLVQIGIRAATPHQREQAERFGVELVEARRAPVGPALDAAAPLYLSVDLDVLDPAFAPGVTHHEPGGLTTREVLSIVQALPVGPVGADVVELNPSRDMGGATAVVAAKLVKEILGRMLSGP